MLYLRHGGARMMYEPFCKAGGNTLSQFSLAYGGQGCGWICGKTMLSVWVRQALKSKYTPKYGCRGCIRDTAGSM